MLVVLLESLSFAFYRKRKYQNNLRRHQTKKFWFQFNDNLENHCLDLKDYDNALKVTQDVDYIFNFACNMGGMGFIENNKARMHDISFSKYQFIKSCQRKQL